MSSTDRPLGQDRQPPPDTSAGNEEGLDELRTLLLASDRARVQDIVAELGELDRLLKDEDALAALVSPALSEAIRRSIVESRDEMVEALHPVIGLAVVRAVSEAIQDLARTVDARVRQPFSPQAIARRVRATFGGISGGELALREALPFEVSEIFLIHRETGLLLRHLSQGPKASEDSDMISGMLTAIRDFAADAFGDGRQGQLDSIQYGDRHILIEAARFTYLAVVVRGVEPAGFRAVMRDTLIDIDLAYGALLRAYDGNASALAPIDSDLLPLMQDRVAEEKPRLSRTQKWILGATAGILLVCVASACVAGYAIWQLLNRQPDEVVSVVTATPTVTEFPTQTPSVTYTATATHTPTATATASPTLTPTSTATSTPAPVTTPKAIVVVLRQNLRSEPAFDGPVVGVAELGEVLEISEQSADGRWWLACCLPDGTSGWILGSLTALEGSLEGVPVRTTP